MKRNIWDDVLWPLLSFIALIFFLCTTAKPADIAPPIALVAATATGYATEQLAAEAALSAATEVSVTIEQAGGIVLAYDGLYYFTTPVAGLNDHFNVRLQFRGKLVAIYHTHPGSNAGLADKYSPDDYATATRLHVASYLRVIATASTYRLDTNERIAMLTGHSLCHGIECKEYYALARRRIAVLYGMARQ